MITLDRAVDNTVDWLTGDSQAADTRCVLL